MAFNKSGYDQQYQRDHIATKRVPFNRTSAADMRLLAWAEAQGNFTRYVKRLIAADMEKKEAATMKKYHVLPEYLTQWGDNCTEDTIITGDEVVQLAFDWGTPVADLLHQLTEISGESRISVDNGVHYVDPAEALAAIPAEVIIDRMDDSVREEIIARYDPDTEEEFLRRYLELSPVDLVIG